MSEASSPSPVAPEKQKNDDPNDTAKIRKSISKVGPIGSINDDQLVVGMRLILSAMSKLEKEGRVPTKEEAIFYFQIVLTALNRINFGGSSRESKKKARLAETGMSQRTTAGSRVFLITLTDALGHKFQFAAENERAADQLVAAFAKATMEVDLEQAGDVEHLTMSQILDCALEDQELEIDVQEVRVIAERLAKPA